MPLSPDYFLLIVVGSGLAIIITGLLIYTTRCSCCCCCSRCLKYKKYPYGEGDRKGSIKQGHGFYVAPTFAVTPPELDHMVFHQLSQVQLYGAFLGANGLPDVDTSTIPPVSVNPSPLFIGEMIYPGSINCESETSNCVVIGSVDDDGVDDMMMFM